MKVRIDTSEVTEALRSIASLFTSEALEHVPHGLIDRLRRLVMDGGLKVCIANLPPTSTADEHVLRLGVRGELLEIASAARAFGIERKLGSVRHLDSPYGR